MFGELNHDYREAKAQLDLSIKEFDQALWDQAREVILGSHYCNEMFADGLSDLSKLGTGSKQPFELIDWLHPSFWEVIGQLSSHKSRCFEGTLRWLNLMPELISWLAGIDSLGVLWLTALPGVGKSTIAAQIISNFTLERPEAHLIYFFCKDGDQKLTCAHSIVQTLSYQLAIQNKGFRQALNRTRLEENFLVTPAVGIRLLFNRLVQKPLLSLINMYDEESIYCIIDGLDEADFSDRDRRSGNSDIQILLTLLSNTPRIRLLVLSRCTTEICSIMSSISSVTREIIAADTEGDIQSFVSCKIKRSKELQARFNYINVDPVDYVCRSAAGNFLWAEVVLSYLEESSSVRELLTAIREVPTHFYELYEQILRRIAKTVNPWKKEIIKEIIWMIICSPRDLQVEELQTIVEMSLKDQFFDFQHLLRAECGTFLRLVSDPITPSRKYVRIIHDTFREYVTSDTSVHEDFHVPVPEAHSQIAAILLQYLSETDFGSRLTPGKYSNWRDGIPIETLSRFPLLQYSATQWTFHLRHSVIENDSPKKLWMAVDKFFVEGPLLIWIEALAIFKELSALSQSVEDLTTWVQLVRSLDPSFISDTCLIENWSKDVSRLFQEFSIVKEFPNAIHDFHFDRFIRPSLLNERFGKNLTTVAGRLLTPLNPPMLGVTDVYKLDYDMAAVSEDGNRYALASIEDIRVLDQKTGGTVSILAASELLLILGARWAVLAMAFSQQNDMFAAVYIPLLSGSALVAYHPILLVFDLDTLRIITSVELSTDACKSIYHLIDRVDFSPDGNSVQAGCWKHTINTGVTSFQKSDILSRSAQAVLVSPDGKWVLCLERPNVRILSCSQSASEVRFYKPSYYQFTDEDPSILSPSEASLAYTRHVIAPFEWWQLWREVTRAYQFSNDSQWFARLTEKGSIILHNLVDFTETVISLPSHGSNVAFNNMVFDRKSEMLAWTFDHIVSKIRDTRIEIWSLIKMSQIGGFYVGARYRERLHFLSTNRILTYRSCVAVWDVLRGLQSDTIANPFQADNWFIGNYYGRMSITYFTNDNIVVIFREDTPSRSNSCPLIMQLYRHDLEHRWKSSVESPLFRLCEAANRFPYSCHGNVIAVGDVIMRISDQNEFSITLFPAIWPFAPESVLTTAFHLSGSYMACLELHGAGILKLHLWDLSEKTPERSVTFTIFDDTVELSVSDLTALILFDPARNPSVLVVLIYQVNDSADETDVESVLLVKAFDIPSLALKKDFRVPNYRPWHEDPSNTYIRGYLSSRLDKLIVCEERKHIRSSQLWVIDLEAETASTELFQECRQLNYLPSKQLVVAVHAVGWILCKSVGDLPEKEEMNDEKQLVRPGEDWMERAWKKLAFLPPSFLPCYESSIAIHPKGQLVFVGEFGKRLFQVSFEW